MKDKNLLEDLLKRKGGKKQKEEYKKKRKKRSSPASQNKSKRSVKSKSFEIMVKIAGGSKSGHGHNKDQLKACLYYIIKGCEDKTIETSLGEEVKHPDVLDKIEKYTIDFKESPSSSSRKSRLFTHAIISLPNNVQEYSKYKDYNDKELQIIFKQALKETMQELFPFNDYLLAMHDNGNNLHAHIPILCKGADGKKIRINKKELQLIRKTLVDKLKENNLNLKATSFLDRENERKELEKDIEKQQKQKRIHIEQGFKPSKAYQVKAPSWVKNKNNLLVLNNYHIDLSKCKNKKQENKILELEERFNTVFKDGSLALKSFLMLYRENKSLATWSLFKNTKVLGTLKKQFQPIALDRHQAKSKIDRNTNRIINEGIKKALQQELEGLLLRNVETDVLINTNKDKSVENIEK